MTKMPQKSKIIKKYTSTLLKRAKCPKILQNEQHNLKSTKMPPKFKKSSVFWLSLGVFLSFFEVSWVFCLFLRFQQYYGHFISFRGYYGHFGVILVILQGFRIFSTFVVYFSHFDSPKGIILEVLVYFQVFDILVILTSKKKKKILTKQYP